MKVEDKWLIIFRKKVVSWQYRAVSDFFFFLRVWRVKEDNIKSDQRPRIPGWPRGGPTPPIRVSPSPPSRMSGHRWSLSPLLPSLTGHPCRRWQVLTRLKRSVGTSVCSHLISAGRLDLKLLTFFFLFTPNLFLPQSSRLSTRTPTFWLLLSDSLVPSATLPVLSQASPAHVPTGRQLLTDPPWPPLVDATATCDVDRSGRLLRSP